MLKTLTDEEYGFTVDLDTVEKTENERGWSCLIADFPEVDDFGIQMQSEIPFWAMNEFRQFVRESKKTSGKLNGIYIRTVSVDGKNRATFKQE